MQKIHFISGLPRSGSTLLAGILRQNPRFAAGMTSGLGGLAMAALRAMGPDGEFSGRIGEERRRRVLIALFGSYYAGPDGAEVVFDTNRQWSAQLPLLGTLFPGAKVIACVRNPAWIMDSIERLVRANALEHSRIFNGPQERATVYSRAEALASRDRLIGYAWSALKEAYYGDEAGRLLLVEYDILCQRPAEVLSLIYRFLGEEAFAHDFDQVEYAAAEFDERIGMPGLHTVKRRVEWKPRRTILPPDIFERFAALAFWHDLSGTKAHKIVQADAGSANQDDPAADGQPPAG